MSGTNAFVTFGFDAFEDFAYEDIPRSVCMKMAVNPYNGLVVLSYQDCDSSMEVVDSLLRQLLDSMAFTSFGEYVDSLKFETSVMTFDKCPFCGGRPDYVADSPVSLRLSQSGLYPGHIECCGGRTLMTGFETKLEAVRVWNDRCGKSVA